MTFATQTKLDKVLWNLVKAGGSLDRGTLRRRTHMRMTELEPILDDLERQGRIGRAALEPYNGIPRQIITFRPRHKPAVR